MKITYLTIEAHDKIITTLYLNNPHFVVETDNNKNKNHKHIFPKVSRSILFKDLSAVLHKSSW